MSAPEWIMTAPVATVVIMGLAFVMTIVFQTTNRLIINRLIGWDKYHAMRKEISAFQKESMAAARANDPKQLEKIKKKQAQINAMNAQMMKPQMVQIAISFLYLPMWFLIWPLFSQNPVFVLPGIGSPAFSILGFHFPNYMIWYMILSLFCSTLFMRLIGSMPIE